MHREGRVWWLFGRFPCGASWLPCRQSDQLWSYDYRLIGRPLWGSLLPRRSLPTLALIASITFVTFHVKCISTCTLKPTKSHQTLLPCAWYWKLSTPGLVCGWLVRPIVYWVGSIAIGRQVHPQTPPSHEEKQSGQPSRISWASTHFCDSVTLLQTHSKRYGYLSGDKILLL